ncbi:D-alanyl-D-alanine carboxypeptidase [Tumebacillus sp. ITR2]|uniref:serine-type D-Ala-D-Ala carboxypeptidase n=1 Tax=Tumebacillus amylolyticus TaxID=2801339 RepID=A0ABS1JFI3_9BACL|nr:D-alanyl-D-alanine carboxypeptidase family protein [Tumebacillus amylolyticus]MBL0388985.1 D-alanyl-D-alanine carboxypeptidase [Tumebacillus amylolyticus]
MKKRFWTKTASSALVVALLMAANVPTATVGPLQFGLSVAHAEDAKQAATDLKIDAPVGLLMDAKTGQLLWSKDEHAKRYPASVTKIMTLLLTYEAVEKGEKKLTDVVPISNNAYGVEGSSVWLDPKEKWTLQDMIEFIAIPSANDACVATAEFIGGSEQAFVDRMNKKAQELGMKDTHFADSNGLHDPNHYSSGYDIALMARELITKYPQVLEVTKTQSKTIRDGKFKLENTNHVLGKIEGMDGLKTGFTDEAGNNLVGTAERNGMRLIGIELGAKDDNMRVNDSIKIMEYGFSNYKPVTVIKKGDAAPDLAPITSGVDKEIQTVAQSDLVIATKNGSPDLEKKAVYKDVTAPVTKDQVVGELQALQDGKVVASVPLVAKQDVEKGSWIRLMFRGIGHFFGGLFSSIGNAFN